MTNITEIAFIKRNVNMSNSSCKVLEKIFLGGEGNCSLSPIYLKIGKYTTLL